LVVALFLDGGNPTTSGDDGHRAVTQGVQPPTSEGAAWELVASLTQDELAKVETKLVEAATQVSTMTAERQQFIYQIDYILLAVSREQGNHVKN
jgi:deferrochelatase/peroxidase EfeB